MNTIIYHSRDLDGLASGSVLLKKFRSEDNLKSIGYHYGEDFDIRKLSRKKVIMADVSFDIEKMFRTAKITQEFIWIDHHLSIFDEFVKYCLDNNIVFEERKLGMITMFENVELGFTYYYSSKLAACEICDKLYNEDENYSRAISLLGQYDTWRNNIKKSLHTDNDWETKVIPFQYGMRLYGSAICDVSEILENIADWRSSLDIGNIQEKGKTILDYQAKLNKGNMKFSFRVEIDGLKGIAFNGGPFNSKTFESKWNENEYDFMMPFSFQGISWNISLYTTKDDVDILSIAKRYGGGGHKQACGFQLEPAELIFGLNGELIFNTGK